MDLLSKLFPISILLFLFACSTNGQNSESNMDLHELQKHIENMTYNEAISDTDDEKRVEKPEEEWKEVLSSGEFRILRKRGTEMPYINEYDGFYEDGVYVCRACGNPLFHSDSKYNSRTGWPSFYEPVRPGAVGEEVDNSFFMTRTETVCARCDSHIGHVFEDGPDPTGLRYCMNSQAMKFIPKDEVE